jgi:catechol 2,3-dioxygenase-like lactoylglutathione lyase family enzyme
MNKYQSAILAGALTINSFNSVGIEIDENASIKDTTTTIMGVNHIGLSVKNLDEALSFYQKATGFELIKREKVTASAHTDTLYGQEALSYEIAILKAPNMLFELTEFSVNKNATLPNLPAQGPGMTHTCFPSPSTNPGYDKFRDAGTRFLTQGNAPVDLGGYGVTYAYGYDPEGNMFELEQLDSKVLTHSGYDSSWGDLGYSMWMSQVALVTHDLEKLVKFYEKVLGFKPYRKGEYKNNKKLDQVANVENLALKAAWFKLNDKSKVMELWQYQNPVTKAFAGSRNATDLGYSYSLEVGDIQKEYQRLTKLGVDFISEPKQLGEFWQVFARDPDSNIFSLRQIIKPNSTFSLKNYEND